MYRQELIKEFKDYKESRWAFFKKTDQHKNEIVDEIIEVITTTVTGNNGDTVILAPETFVAKITQDMLKDAAFENSNKKRLYKHLEGLREKIIDHYIEKLDAEILKNIRRNLINIQENNRNHAYLNAIVNKIIEQLDKAIKVIPNLLYALGNEAYNNQKFKEAKKHFSKCLACLQQDEKADNTLKVDTINSIGTCLFYMAEELRELKADPEDIYSLYSDAKEEFLNALKIDASSKKVRKNLSVTEIAIKAYKEITAANNVSNQGPTPKQ